MGGSDVSGKEGVSGRELTTRLVFLLAPVVDNSLLQGFRQYLLGRVSEATARDYVNAVARKEWPPTKRSHVKAWRHYVQYLFSIGKLDWE